MPDEAQSATNKFTRPAVVRETMGGVTTTKTYSGGTTTITRSDKPEERITQEDKSGKVTFSQPGATVGFDPATGKYSLDALGYRQEGLSRSVLEQEMASARYLSEVRAAALTPEESVARMPMASGKTVTTEKTFPVSGLRGSPVQQEPVQEVAFYSVPEQVVKVGTIPGAVPKVIEEPRFFRKKEEAEAFAAEETRKRKQAAAYPAAVPKDSEAAVGRAYQTTTKSMEVPGKGSPYEYLQKRKLAPQTGFEGASKFGAKAAEEGGFIVREGQTEAALYAERVGPQGALPKAIGMLTSPEFITSQGKQVAGGGYFFFAGLAQTPKFLKETGLGFIAFPAVAATTGLPAATAAQGKASSEFIIGAGASIYATATTTPMAALPTIAYAWGAPVVGKSLVQQTIIPELRAAEFKAASRTGMALKATGTTPSGMELGDVSITKQIGREGLASVEYAQTAPGKYTFTGKPGYVEGVGNVEGSLAYRGQIVRSSKFAGIELERSVFNVKGKSFVMAEAQPTIATTGGAVTPKGSYGKFATLQEGAPAKAFLAGEEAALSMPGKAKIGSMEIQRIEGYGYSTKLAAKAPVKGPGGEWLFGPERDTTISGMEGAITKTGRGAVGTAGEASVGGITPSVGKIGFEQRRFVSLVGGEPVFGETTQSIAAPKTLSFEPTATPTGKARGAFRTPLSTTFGEAGAGTKALSADLGIVGGKGGQAAAELTKTVSATATKPPVVMAATSQASIQLQMPRVFPISGFGAKEEIIGRQVTRQPQIIEMLSQTKQRPQPSQTFIGVTTTRQASEVILPPIDITKQLTITIPKEPEPTAYGGTVPTVPPPPTLGVPGGFLVATPALKMGGTLGGFDVGISGSRAGPKRRDTTKDLLRAEFKESRAFSGGKVREISIASGGKMRVPKFKVSKTKRR